MRKGDLRFNGQHIALTNASARGRVVRNAGNFTRGSQLISHEFMMTFAGIKIPFFFWLAVFVISANTALFMIMREHEIMLCIMKIYSDLWGFMEFQPYKFVNLTLPDGSIRNLPMISVADHPAVAFAWSKFTRAILGSAIMSAFIAAPLTVWFVEFSKRRGKEILEERHERGSVLVSTPVLQKEIQLHNRAEIAKDCERANPPIDPSSVRSMTPAERMAAGIHMPYTIASIPYPYRLEQSHTMLIGTTGAGKTTQLRSLVAQMRKRGHRAVIFDLTGAFVESFYNPDTDTILNPMDQRCPPWTIFNDCKNYPEFISASEALIPHDGSGSDPFWVTAARTLFVEMCMKLQERGETSNAAIAHKLMTADLKTVHKYLTDTIADPLTAPEAARMAESIRSVFNTNAHAIRFLPDVTTSDLPPFSINEWMAREDAPGSILFITSDYIDLGMNRTLLTLWMNLAVYSIMRQPRTRSLRTWFLFDEVHALHRLHAIEHGLQTARGFGGAFVLGIHSIDKLAETYGEQGAINLCSLARTKLILTTGDIETARKCSEFIGSREVREMDEAYSYGYNNTRDASTITPRKAIEALVMPDDIKDLASLAGFLKFPDGFPAADIKLTYKDYPAVAPGFVRRTTFEVSTYTPKRPQKGAEGEGEAAGGMEQNGQGFSGAAAPDRELTDAEREAEELDIENQDPAYRDAREQVSRTSPATINPDATAAKASLVGAKLVTKGFGFETGPKSARAAGERNEEKNPLQQVSKRPSPASRPHEKQTQRELRDGIGTEEEPEADRGPNLSQDDMGIGD